MNKTITAENAPAAVGPYCHAKLAGNTLYTSDSPASCPRGWRPRPLRRWTT